MCPCVCVIIKTTYERHTPWVEGGKGLVSSRSCVGVGNGANDDMHTKKKDNATMIAPTGAAG